MISYVFYKGLTAPKSNKIARKKEKFTQSETQYLARTTTSARGCESNISKLLGDMQKSISILYSVGPKNGS